VLLNESPDASVQHRLRCHLSIIGAVAVSNMTGQDFAAMLDRAILRSQGNGRNVPQIELRAEPEGSDGR
jgi:hypothetical protein